MLIDQDIEQIPKEKSKVLMYGDFNAHIGDENGSDFGVPGNLAHIGNNGTKLLCWMDLWDRVVGKY